jgi:hypothetical protein
MKLGEVDKFCQPVVARTIRIHPLREEFPGRIDSDFRKDCKQEDQRDGLVAKAEPNHPASPIGKNIPNREANDAKGSTGVVNGICWRAVLDTPAQNSVQNSAQNSVQNSAQNSVQNSVQNWDPGPEILRHALWPPFRGSRGTQMCSPTVPQAIPRC